MRSRDEQATNTTIPEEQSTVGRRAMSLSTLRSLPGLALVGLAGVLYSRAGYGLIARSGTTCQVVDGDPLHP